MKTYSQLLEDIELVSGISRATRGDIGAMQDEFNYGPKKNLGKIHKDYSLHKVNGDFFINHDKSNKVVGHISNDTPHKSKSLKVGLTAIHPDHTKKKIRHSLAIAAYKHLHGKHGYEIKSGNEQSVGGASIWQHLMKDPSTKQYVHAVHEPPGGKKRELGQATKLHTGDIWTSGSGEVRRKAASKDIKMHPFKGYENDSGYHTSLVLKRKTKGINEMAQTIARAKQVLGMLNRSTTDEEDREIKKLSNKEKRSNKILYGKGGRIMKKPPSVTRGDIFR